MTTCLYNENYTIICKNKSLIPRLTSEDIQSLTVDDLIGSGSQGEVHSGFIDNIPIAIKIISDGEVPLSFYDKEICFQQEASKYDLAPKILGYWICPTKRIIIMEYVQGTLFRDLILYQSNCALDIFCEIIRNVVYQNQIVGIVHNDIHASNVFIDNDKVIFIDYGEAVDYPGNDKLLPFLLKGIDEEDYDTYAFGFFTDLMYCASIFSDNFVDMKSDNLLLIIKLDTILMDHNLNGLVAWQKIYQSFFEEHGRIPGSDDVYEIVYELLSHALEDMINKEY
jgi:serine/threonine protein kinase